MDNRYLSPRPVAKPINFYQATGVQIFLLKCIGFLHLELDAPTDTYRGKLWPWKKAANNTLMVFGILLVLSGWISVGFNAAIALGSLLKPDPNNTANPIMQAFVQIPFATYNFRGVVILSVLLLKRRAWAKLVRLVNRVLAETFPTGNATALRRWKIMTIGGATITLVLLVIFEILNNLEYVALFNKTLDSDGILDPLPLNFCVWQYIVWWTFCSSLPFYLSQQVAICILLIGRMLTDCCRVLIGELKEEMENLRILTSSSVALELHLLKSDLQRVDILEDATERVTGLKLRYLDMCKVVQYVDHHFGSFIFFMYGLDLLTMFGSVASIVESQDKGIGVVRAYYYVSTVIFMSYCTLFMWPLVMAYEESLKINIVLHQFMTRIESISSVATAQGRQLHAVLQTFVIASKDQLLLFSGAEILHVTRTFIFTTFTLLISFVLITKEVLLRVDESPRQIQHAENVLRAFINATTTAPSG